MVALYRPGPMDNIPTYINRKHGEEPVDCLHPHAGADPQGDLRRHHLPGAGHADRPGDGAATRSARPTCCAAPWARKTRPRWPSSRPRFVDGAVQEGRQEGRGRLHLRAGRQVRRLRLQQEPRRGLRAGQLSHGLPEGELPRGVPRRLDDARHGQHRQARHVRLRGAQKSASRVLPPCVNASEVDFLAEPPTEAGKPGAIRYSLAALKNIGAQAVETHRRRAQPPRAASRTLADFAARLNPKALNKRALETLAAAGAFDALEANRALVHGNVEQILAFANRRADQCGAGHRRSVRRRQRRRGRRSTCARVRRGRRWSGCSTSSTPSASSSPAIRSMPTSRCSHKLGVKTLRRVRGDGRARRCGGRLAGIVIVGARAAVAEGQQVRLRHVLRRHRAVRGGDLLRHAGAVRAICWSPARRCCSAVEAERDGDTLKMRVQAIAVARRGGRRRAARPEGRARPARHRGRARRRSTSSRRC